MEAIDLCVLCVLCVFVVRSTPSLGGMYLRIHFTHQIQESLSPSLLRIYALVCQDRKRHC
ncbi:hypothetical protein [Microcystis aeruginosa]|uniref:hypothetical protein n=1 Tax=Microcystis aeruginosa TaxID=1126 RepID=UPI0023301C9E|nr:hypothetical protein [Microcystis aeruginosa]MDB9432062.1 hypothetical protein [Microcystis aeruginosa CS-552/01]